MSLRNALSLSMASTLVFLHSILDTTFQVSKGIESAPRTLIGKQQSFFPCHSR
jgi:hypothetical protein